MNVLVTGGMGYIGSHTCIQLLAAGHTPIIIDNLCNSKPLVLDRIEQVAGTSGRRISHSAFKILRQQRCRHLEPCRGNGASKR